MSKLTNTTVMLMSLQWSGVRGAYTPHLNTATQLKY